MAKWKDYPYKMTLPLTDREHAIMELAIRDDLFANRVRMMRQLMTQGLKCIEDLYTNRQIAAKVASLKKDKNKTKKEPG